MEDGKIIFLIGASGAGKSTLVDELANHFKGRLDAECFHFDAIGVPAYEDMVKSYGSAKEWQKQKTYQWVDKLIQQLSTTSLIIFEGQTEPRFIIEGAQAHNFKNYKIILVHAAPEIRHYRLKHLRHQPELLTPDMDNWATYLMEQAKTLKLDVIDTSDLDKFKTYQFMYDYLRS